MDAPLPVLDRFFTPWDLGALALFALCWIGMTRAIERRRASGRSTHQLMEEYRRRWMREMALRENRMMDTNLLTALRNGAAFFASGCIIAIGGAVALLGRAEEVTLVARDLAGSGSLTRGVWEAKLLLILALLVNVFLKFVWAHRVFGYCAVVMGATPVAPPQEPGRPRPDLSPEAQRAADCAARLNISAARSFNRGLRALYFAMASLAWFLGPAALAAASLLTAAILYRREFRSETRAALLAES